MNEDQKPKETFYGDLKPVLAKWIPRFIEQLEIWVKDCLKWVKDYLRHREEEKNKQSKAISKDKL